jgi:signal transduction histidine kinase
MNEKRRDRSRLAEMFKKEWLIVEQSQEIQKVKDIPKDRLLKEYRALGQSYKKLLTEIMKITRIGDVNYKKLMAANDRIRDQKTELEHLNDELREANAVKDKFYSIIAHDLKDPFQVLLISSEVLHQDYIEMEEEEILKYISGIYRTSGSLASLLENLLQWSRTQYGEIECNPKIIPLDLLAKEQIDFFITRAEKKNINLISKIPGNAVVYADENMVQSIFRNLVGNALKFTHPGGNVFLSAEEDGDFIVASVSDTGIGIPTEKLETLFNLGRNLVSTGTAKEKGTGLGLMLCKEFVEKNGGTMRVTSQPGKGSVFSFSLPRPV